MTKQIIYSTEGQHLLAESVYSPAEICKLGGFSIKAFRVGKWPV